MAEETKLGLAYLAVLVVLGVVVLNIPPGSWLYKLVAKPLLKGLRSLGKYVWRSVKEIAAWLGYEGKRILLFLAGLGFLLWVNYFFGWGVASKFAVVYLIFLLTSRKRRMVRNSKLIHRMDARLNEFGKKLDKKLNDLPSPKEAKGAYQDWKQDRATTSTGVDPTTGAVTAEAMTDPNYFHRSRPAWESFRAHMRNRKDQP